MPRLAPVSGPPCEHGPRVLNEAGSWLSFLAYSSSFITHSKLSIRFDEPVDNVIEKVLVIQGGRAAAALDNHLAAAEIWPGHEADRDVLPHVEIHLVDPVESVAWFLWLPAGVGSVVARHFEFFYHGLVLSAAGVCILYENLVCGANMGAVLWALV